MSNPDDDDRLLAVAGSVSDGSPVDWNVVREQFADSNHAAIVDELQRLHDLAAAHSDMSSWGSLHILEPLGHGSFATVYRAFDEDLQREVALKISRAQESSTLDPQRAVAEARLLAQVQHTNVVTVFGAHRRDDAIALEMQLIEGETLEEIVRRQGPFSAEETTRIGLDLCRAVAAVHAAGLIHGDIKAHNVMREKGGRIVLMDFGTGKALKDAVAPRSDFAGTPLYLAPEVFAGRPRTKASDIYSLGVLLYYLSTAAYPVWGATRTEVGREHQRAESHRRLRDVRPNLPEPFVSVVERAIAEDPARRYRTAGEFEAALADTLGGSRRRPAPAIAAAVLLVVLGVVGTYIAFRPRQQSTDSVVTRSAAAPAPTVVGQPYSVEAALFRAGRNGTNRLQGTDRLSAGDDLYLQLQTSVPTHVYVVNEDDRGNAILLFPLPGQPHEALPAGVPNRLPGFYRGEERHWEVSSAGGREHFVIFASPTPLPDVQQRVASLPAPQPDAPLNYAAVPPELLSNLRSVGGLVTAPKSSASRPRLSLEFTAPLRDGPEEVRGVWIRQATFENPGR